MPLDNFETRRSQSPAVEKSAAAERQDRALLMHSIRENGAAFGDAWWAEICALAGVARIGELPTPTLRLLASTLYRAGWLLTLERACRPY